MNYWLFKSEPNTFSIDDLVQSPKHTTHWNGIRNYQVRNLLRDDIKVGDQVFFYHSNANPPGIVGVMEVVKAGYPDFTAQDKNSPYFDPKSSADNPIWFMVDVRLVEKWSHMVTLNQLKTIPELNDMMILRKGNRLSVTRVTPVEWERVVILSQG